MFIMYLGQQSLSIAHAMKYWNYTHGHVFEIQYLKEGIVYVNNLHCETLKIIVNENSNLSLQITNMKEINEELFCCETKKSSKNCSKLHLVNDG